MKDAREQLQERLHEDIPLVRAMGLSVIECSPESVSLRAPLERNDNHKSTAFGGSLYSVAVLAGWGLVYWNLRECGRQGRVVIQEGRMRYLHPVAEDIVATCRLDSRTRLDALFRSFDRRALGRIDLSCTIAAAGVNAVEFEGRYVVTA